MTITPNITAKYTTAQTLDFGRVIKVGAEWVTVLEVVPHMGAGDQTYLTIRHASGRTRNIRRADSTRVRIQD